MASTVLPAVIRHAHRPFSTVFRPLLRSVYPKRHPDFASLAAVYGFKVQEHQVTTDDGYILTLHRLYDEESQLTEPRPVVYFHHGLLTNSELFILGDRKEKCLPYVLLERGYDVWLGNNRGNKYATHQTYDQSDPRYWDFSLDEFAQFDIPAIIHYVLHETQEKALSYVGFSQGTTQMFAALSMHPELNKKVNLFVALSPVMVPQPLTNPLIKPFVQTPSLLGHIFGSGPLLPFVNSVVALVPPHMYRHIIDTSLSILFSCTGKNITTHQKRTGYPYLYSVSSVKTVIHWFQIIRQQTFHRFFDVTTLQGRPDDTVWDVVMFEMSTVTVPCLLVYGDDDILVDIDKSLDLLKTAVLDVQTIKCESYEHMDTLWAEDCDQKVFNPVLERLDAIKEQRNDTVKTAGSVFI